MTEQQQLAKLCLELIENSRPKEGETAFQFTDRVTTAKNFLVGVFNEQLTVSPAAPTAPPVEDIDVAGIEE